MMRFYALIKWTNDSMPLVTNIKLSGLDKSLSIR